MKQKHFILALVAMLWSFSVSAQTTVVTTEAELREALAAGGEITLGADIQLTAFVELGTGDVTFDLGGYDITAGIDDGYVIKNKSGATLKIYDSEGSSNVNGVVYTITGSKTEVYGGTYNAIGNYVFLNAGGELVINKATVNGLDNYPVFSYNAGHKLVINDIVVNGECGCLNAYGANGTVEINDGEFNFTGREGKTYHIVYISTNTTCTINGGTFRKVGDVDVNAEGGGGVCVNGGAMLNVTGGTFDGAINDIDNYNSNTTIAVSGGVFSDKSATNYITTGSTVTMAGTTYIKTESGTLEEVKPGVVEGLTGEGTEANPYLIKTTNDLVFFRNSVNAGETKYNADGVYVALGANIDLVGQDWSVNIGDDCAYTFDGIFDGKGFTIYNLTSTETAQKDDGYICTGLFGAIYGNAVVKNLTIDNVTINTGDFTGNNVGAVVGFAYNCKGSIENVKVTGDININAAKATGVGAILGYDYYSPALKIENCSVIGNDGSAILGKSYVGGIAGYASSKIALNGNTVDNVSITATGSAGAIAGIMLGGSSADGNIVKNVALTTTGEYWANSAAVVAGTISGSAVTVANTTVENVTANGAAAPLVGGQLVEKPEAPIAKVEAKIGDKYYTTLDAALAAEGNEVELLTTYVIAAGETKTLDLKGKTVTMVYAEDATANHAMISNYGDLTIESSVEGGKLSYTYTGANLGTSYAANTITSNPGSVLTVKSGTIENLTYDQATIAYAIDGLTNGGAGDVTVNIEGGVITSKRQAVRIFANSTTNTGTLIISGGDLTGRVIVQNANAKANLAALNITGGTFNANAYKTDVLYVGGSQNATIDIDATVSGGTFNGEITDTNVKGFISGGTYTTDVTAYCADNFICQDNGDGTYGVIVDPNYLEELTIVDGESTEFVNESEVTVGVLTYTRFIKEENLNKWQSLYVPFEIPVQQLLDAGYEVAYFNGFHNEVKEDGEVTAEAFVELVKIKVGTLRANFPYVIKATTEEALRMELVLDDVKLHSTSAEAQTVVECSQAFKKYEFRGTYKQSSQSELVEDADDVYVISGGVLTKLSATGSNGAFRIYMTVTTKSGSPVVDESNQDAAKSIALRVVGEENEDGTTTIYDVEMDREQTVDYIYDLQGRRVVEPQKGSIYIVNGKKVVIK